MSKEGRKESQGMKVKKEKTRKWKERKKGGRIGRKRKEKMDESACKEGWNRWKDCWKGR